MPAITCCATLGFAAFDLATAAREIAGLGFTKVELSEMGIYCRHLPCRQADLSEVKRILDDCGLTAVGINASTVPEVAGQAVEELLPSVRECAEEMFAQGQWFLEAAAELGVKILTFPIGRRKFGEDWDREMKTGCEVCRRLAELAERLGVGINLEVPHLFQLTDSVEHVQAIFELIDHPVVGATVDSSHWGVIGYDMAAFVDWLGPRLTHVHLRDSAGPDTKDFAQDLELTPGKGVVDFGLMAEILDRSGYAGEVNLDFEYRFADLPRIRDEYRKGLDNLAQRGWQFARR